MFYTFAVLFEMLLHLLAIGLLMLSASPDSIQGGRYQQPLFQVTTKPGILYAEVDGYWSELDDKTTAAEKVFKLNHVVDEQPLELRLDLYLPKDDTLAYRPLVMLIHGGAFYFGSRKDHSITRWCRHFASLGYVAASIDYRLGFFPTKNDIDRAGYRALQDAHAALRFLVDNQEHYGIDTSMIFVGGSSSGGITALNLVYLNNQNRPASTLDLGNVETSGNDLTNHFSIKGVVNMWGALFDTSAMRGHHVPILAFHGDKDQTVPYDYDYPFQQIGDANKLLVSKMYGSSCIVDYAQKHGQQATLYTFEGSGHSPHNDPHPAKAKRIFHFIQDKMIDFFYQIIRQKQPKGSHSPN